MWHYEDIIVNHEYLLKQKGSTVQFDGLSRKFIMICAFCNFGGIKNKRELD